jgi:Tfp pilus assembly protein PilZ
MLRENNRNPGDGYCIQILIINGEVKDDLSQKSYYVENISKGGFRFITDIEFEIDDRLRVLLRFPDGRSQEVLGRVCYCDDEKSPDGYSYGFSVLEGFYSLFPGVASS